MTPRGALLCFTGIDGSGKTTQAQLLVDWLASRGIPAKYAWSRGEVLAVRRLLLSVGRKALGTSTREIATDPASYRQYQSRKSKLMRYAAVRVLWSAVTYVEHILQINADIGRRLNNGDWVVCDRYRWDSLIDLAVLNNKPSEWLVNPFNRLTGRLIPRPSIVFLIDIPPEEALRRKDDIPSLEYVQARAAHYRCLARRNGFTVVEGCRSAAAIHADVVQLVSDLLGKQGQA